MKSITRYHLGCFLALLANFAFAESSHMACLADAGQDQLLNCITNCVTLDASNSTTGPDIIYTWTGPDINASNMNEQFPSVCEAGVYNLTVENTTEGCSTTDEVIVLLDQVIPTASAQVSGIITCNSPGVMLDGSASSSGANIVYEWIEANGNLISITQIVFVDFPGVYTLVVTNTDNGCSAEMSVQIDADITAPIANVITTPYFPCQLNGFATLDATGSSGSGFLDFEWQDQSGTPVGTTPFIEVSDAGPFLLILSDSNNGCTATEWVFPGQDQSLGVNYSVVQPASCGNCDGSIDIIPETAGPFTYDWSDNTFDGQEDPVGLCEGVTYYVTIADAIGFCQTVLEIADFDTNIGLDVTSTYTDCGVNDGTATATVAFGANNPTFTWSNGATTSTISDLSPGGYSVTVEDAITGCSTHKNVIVEEDPACQVQISGYVHNDDTDQDCDDMSVDGGVYNIMITLSNGDITFTDINGYYEFTVDPGSYQLSINLNTPQFLPLCTDTITVDLPDFGSVSENNNFFVINNAIQDLNIKVVKGPARPGFEQHVLICAMNFGENPIDGTVVFTHDPLQVLANTSGPGVPTYDAGTSTVEWDFVGLPPGAVWVFHAYLNLDASVPIGTPLNFYFALEPIVGDINPANNVIECSVIVTGSYDPNDKRAIPMGESSQGYIVREDSLINYTIRFQNTGTDTAFTVVVRDTLDIDLDMNTLVPLPSCRPYRLDVIADRVLEFTFENILLPDSTTNEPESNGFVMYDIELLPGLEYGTTIENRAGIYFDYNLPIITNTTLNTLSKRRESIAGTLQTETGAAIGDVQVELLGGDTSTTLLTSGDYRFDYIPVESEYTILPTKNDDPVNGVTSFDLVLITKHFLELTLLDSPYKIIAADVNKSGSISTVDVLELRKIILFINANFPDNESWRFVEAAHAFPDPEDPFSSTFPEEVFLPNFLEEQLNADFIGVKVGDVNASVVPGFVEGEVRDQPVDDLFFKMEDRSLQKGVEYSIPFKASNFNAMVSCQFTIEFDPNRLEFIRMEKGSLAWFDDNNLGLTHVEDGFITLSWTGQKSRVAEAEVLFNLQFKARRSAQLSQVLHLNSRYTQKEAYRETNTSFELLNVELLFENKESKSVESDQLRLYPNQPNPFKEETILPFYLPEGGVATLLVYDLNGRLLKKDQQNFEKGLNQFSIKGSAFPNNGLYYYKIKTTKASVLGKMVLTF